MFDTKFEMALSEFMCAEGETLMIENEVIDHEFSDKFLRNMDKLINRRRKPYFRMINTVGKRAACIALAIFIASATTVMSVDALRNAVFNFFEKAFGKNSTVYVGSDENHPETIEEIYEITYDLSDYDIRDVDNCEWYRRKEYYHGDTTIVFYQYTQEMFDGININTEDAVIEETDISVISFLWECTHLEAKKSVLTAPTDVPGM